MKKRCSGCTLKESKIKLDFKVKAPVASLCACVSRYYQARKYACTQRRPPKLSVRNQVPFAANFAACAPHSLCGTHPLNLSLNANKISISKHFAG